MLKPIGLDVLILDATRCLNHLMSHNIESFHSMCRNYLGQRTNARIEVPFTTSNSTTRPIQIVSNLVFHERIIHIEVNYHFMCVQAENGSITLPHVFRTSTCKHFYQGNNTGLSSVLNWQTDASKKSTSI